MIRQYLIPLTKFFFHKRPWIIHLFHVILVCNSLVLAWLLRFDFTLPDRGMLLWSGILLVVVRLFVLRLFDLQHGWWHFSSISDALNVVKAVSLGTVDFFILNRYLLGLTSFPRSIYVLEPIMTAGLLAGSRLASRVLAETVRRDTQRSKRVLLVGAGFAAQMILRELERPNSGYVSVGCVDDDLSKQKICIHNVPVLGRVEDLPTLVAMHAVDEILIVIPSATGAEMQQIIEVCQSTQLPFKTVPALLDIIRGEASVRE